MNAERFILTRPKRKLTAAQIEFRTSSFEFAHGHRPRGTGGWAFEFESGKPEFAPSTLTYGEAKRWAVKEAIARGCAVVTVCS